MEQRGSCGEVPPIERNFKERVEIFKGDLEKKDLTDSVKSTRLFLSMKHSVVYVIP